jgi:hypothetical protein
VISINKNALLLPLNLDHLFNVGDILSIINRDSSALISDSTIILCVQGEERNNRTQNNGRVSICDLNTHGDSIVNIIGHVLHVEQNHPLNGKDRFGIRLSDGSSLFF